MASGKRVKGLTVEINGDVTGLDQALKKTNSALNNTQRELNDVNKLLKLDPKNTELLTQKQKLLSESIANTKSKLETLKTAQEQALKQLENKEIGQKQYDALQREIAETEQELKKFETAADGVESELKEMANEADNAADKTDELDISLGSMIKNAAVNLAVDAMKAIGDKAIEAAKYVIDVGSTFEASMDKVAAISGATGGDLAKLTDKAKEMGSTTKFSASESAQAFEYMAMAGWKTNDMLEGIDGIMALAAASGEDLATTSDIVTDALTAFGESAEESGRLADIMAAASSNANTNVGMMGETFKYAAPVAGSLGASMEDTAVAVGLMANSGIKASQAGTALRSGLTNLVKPTKQMKEWMEKYNIAVVENEDGSVNLRDTMIDLREKMGHLEKTEQAAAAGAIFGKNAMSGWLAVINASDQDFDQLCEAIDNSQGAAQGMADTMQSNLTGAMTIFKSALEGLGIELYNKAVGPLTGAVEFATGVINGLTNVLKDHRSENDKVMDDVVKANKAVEESLANVGKIQTEAAANAGKIDVLTQALVSLNTQDGLDEAQKRRLKEVYDELVKLVPDLAGKYDEETGKVNATTEAIYDLAKARKDEIIEAGRMRAINDIYDKMGEALGNLQLAAANVEGLKKQHSMWEQMRDKVGEAAANYSQFIYEYNNGLRDNTGLENLKSELMGIAQEALNAGAITTETYNEIDKMFRDNWTDADLNQAVEMLTYNMEQTDAKVEEATGEMEDLQKVYDEANISVTNLENSTESFTEITEDELKATDDSVRSTQSLIDEKIALKKATDDSAEATEKNKKATDEETTAVKNSGEAWAEKRKAQRAAREETENDIASGNNMTKTAQEEADALKDAVDAVHENAKAHKTLVDAADDARNAMTKSYEDIKKSADEAFKIDAFGGWKDVQKNNMEEFQKSLTQQILGMNNYKANLQTVKDNLSQTAPEFVQYLEDMGQAGSYLVWEIAESFSKDDAGSKDAITGLVSQWYEAMDIQDGLTDAIAKDKLALELGLGSLSEAAIQSWEDLGLAFDEGVGVIRAKGGELSQETSDAFWGAVDAAKAVGAEVPKGLAESIRNSEDPELAVQQATEAINESLRGRGESLLAAAHDLGIVVPPGVAEAIQDKAVNGADLQNAVGTLVETIRGKAPGFEAAGTEAGEAAGSATAAGITNKEEDVTGAADSVVDSAKESASKSSEVFNIVGHSAMEALKGGIREKSQEVSGALTALLTIVKNNGTNHGNQIFPGIGSDIDAHIVSGISKDAGTVTGALNSIMDAMNTDASTQCDNIRKTFYQTINDVATAVSNTHLSFPSIQIPHVRWTWEWLGYADGGGTYYPNFYVDWYAKAMKDGMILDNPTIFGMMNGKFLGAGEAGSETVVGTNSLMNMIKDAVDSSAQAVNIGTINIPIQTMDKVDAKSLARQIEPELAKIIIKRGAKF